MKNDKKAENEIIKDYGKVSRQILRIIEEKRKNNIKNKENEGER